MAINKRKIGKDNPGTDGSEQQHACQNMDVAHHDHLGLFAILYEASALAWCAARWPADGRMFRRALSLEWLVDAIPIIMALLPL
jgi:hypothetical protein